MHDLLGNRGDPMNTVFSGIIGTITAERKVKTQSGLRAESIRTKDLSERLGIKHLRRQYLDCTRSTKDFEFPSMKRTRPNIQLIHEKTVMSQEEPKRHATLQQRTAEPASKSSSYPS